MLFDRYCLFGGLFLFDFYDSITIQRTFVGFDIEHRKTGLTLFIETGKVESDLTRSIGDLSRIETEGIGRWW